jgi:hypothetical protein
VIGLGVRGAAVRTKKYRFDCTVRDDTSEVGFALCDPTLFDIEADPIEERNLAHDPGHQAVLKDLYHRVHRWLRVPGCG